MNDTLTLQTQRLTLKPISVDELEEVFESVRDPEISKYMSWDPHNSIDQTKSFIERLRQEMEAGKTYTWSIFLEGAFCGIVSLLAITRQHRALTYDRAELAYWVSRKYQRMGIMTEACQQVIGFAFGQMNLHRLTVSHVSENDASQNLIKKLDFRYIGEEHEAFQKNGKWYNHKLYERINKN